MQEKKHHIFITIIIDPSCQDKMLLLLLKSV